MDKNGYLTRKMFYVIMGIAVTMGISISTYIINRTDTLTEYFNHEFTTVKTDIASINTNIGWIKEKLK